MKFERARLCLDCEEIHEQDRCPCCGSGEWAYPYLWVCGEDDEFKKSDEYKDVPEVEDGSKEIEPYRYLPLHTAWM